MNIGRPPSVQGAPMMPAAPAMPVAPTVPPPPPLVDWFTGSDLHGPVPLREWLVRDMIPMRTVTLLYGDGGTGKSLLALQLAVSTALNYFWLNAFPSHGPVVYFSAEDDRDELHRRLDSILMSYGRNVSDLHKLAIANMAGLDAVMASVGKNGAVSPNDLFEAILTRVRLIGAKLVVLDTLADIFPGNENDRSQVRQFVGLMRRMAISCNCAVLILAHPSVTGINSGTGASGSTAWSNSVRSRLYFERIKDEGYERNPDARRLKVMKSNYGPIDVEIEVAWNNGTFVAQTVASGTETDARGERIFLGLLASTTAQGRYFSTLHAPNEFSKMPGCEGLSKRALKGAMERLLATGSIVIQTIREHRRDRRVIILNGQLI